MLLVKRLLSFALLGASAGFGAGTDEVIIREAPDQARFDRAQYGQYIVDKDAAILGKDDARALLNAASRANGVVHENANARYGTIADFSNLSASDYYCLIHVLRWADPTDDPVAGKKAVQPEKQNWYVYHGGQAWRQEDFKDNKRLFGSKNVWLLYIHLNIRANFKYTVQYDIDLKDITPAPLSHLLDLAKLFSTSAAETGETYAIWGAHNITVSHLPNEMSITAESVQPALDPPVTERVGDPVTFVNEGRYHYDFSVGFPVRKISQLNIDSTNGTVNAQKIDQSNIYALVDLYPWPTDVRNQTFSPFPYFISGVAIAKQPLHKILLGVGYGPRFAQFYIGAVFVKQDQLGALTQGQIANAAQVAAGKRQGFDPQLSLGLNLTVRGVNDLLKKKQ